MIWRPSHQPRDSISSRRFSSLSRPYQLRLAHRSTRARMDEATDAELGVVARGTRDALAAVTSALPGAPYNVIVHTAPPGVPTRDMHWHLEIVPRTSVVAGFELCSGIFANSVAPEQAATVLRGDP